MVHLKQRLLSAMILVVFCVCIVSSSYVLWFSKPIIEDNTRASNASALFHTSSNLDLKLEEIQRSAIILRNYIQDNIDPKRLYNTPEYEQLSLTQLNTFVRNIQIEQNQLSSLYIYIVPKKLTNAKVVAYADRNDDGVLEPLILKHPALFEAKQASYYYDTWMNPDPLWQIGPYREQLSANQNDELTCNMRVQIDGSTIAVISVGYPFEKIESLLQNTQSQSNVQYLLIDEKALVLFDEHLNFGTNLAHIFESRFTEIVDTASRLTYGKRYMTSGPYAGMELLSKTLLNDWQLTLVMNKALYNDPYLNLLYVLIGILFLSTLLAVLFSWRVTSNIFNPIQLLSQYVHQYKTPELREPLVLPRHWVSQEVQQLAHSVFYLEDALKTSMSALIKYNETLEREAYNKGIILKSMNSELQSAVDVLERQGTELQQINELLETNKSAILKAQRQVADSEKIASVGYLISGISHELNTPIGNTITLVTFIESEIKKFATQTSDNTRPSLIELHGVLKQSLILIDNNLNQAKQIIERIKALTVSPDPSFMIDINLKELLESAGKKIFDDYPDREISLNVIADSHIQVHTDPDKLVQIFEHLFSNSMAHGFDSRYEGQIIVRYHQIGDELIIHYFDDGIGIEPDHIPHIFTPFFSTKFGIYKGLGLSLVHNLVTKYFNGSIQCDSNTTLGVHFELRLKVPNWVRRGDL